MFLPILCIEQPPINVLEDGSQDLPSLCRSPALSIYSYSHLTWVGLIYLAAFPASTYTCVYLFTPSHLPKHFYAAFSVLLSILHPALISLRTLVRLYGQLHLEHPTSQNQSGDDSPVVARLGRVVISANFSSNVLVLEGK